MLYNLHTLHLVCMLGLSFPLSLENWVDWICLFMALWICKIHIYHQHLSLSVTRGRILSFFYPHITNFMPINLAFWWKGRGGRFLYFWDITSPVHLAATLCKDDNQSGTYRLAYSDLEKLSEVILQSWQNCSTRRPRICTLIFCQFIGLVKR